MNELLNQLIDEQTPEQAQQAFATIRKERGYCPNDMSVEEALGISVSKVVYQEMNDINNKYYDIDCNSSNNISNQAVSNNMPYSLAA